MYAFVRFEYHQGRRAKRGVGRPDAYGQLHTGWVKHRPVLHLYPVEYSVQVPGMKPLASLFLPQLSVVLQVEMAFAGLEMADGWRPQRWVCRPLELSDIPPEHQPFKAKSYG